MAANFGDGVRRKTNSVRCDGGVGSDEPESADENVAGEGTGTPPLASSLELGTAPFDVTPVTMRDALAEAARLREENLKILQVMQWGQQQLSFGGVTKSPMTRPQKAATLAHPAST